MTKRTNETTTTAATTTGATQPSNKAAKLPLHDSQKALAKRALKAFAQGNLPVVASEPGSGKTLIAAALCRRIAKSLGARTLSVLVTTNAAQAKKLGVDFGSLLTNGVTFGNTQYIRKRLGEEGGVHVTMSGRFFKEHILGLEGKAFTGLDKAFAGPTGATDIVFVLDELDGLVKDWGTRLKKLRSTKCGAALHFVGLTATPGANDEQLVEIFGKQPAYLDFEGGEQAAWDAKMKLQPTPPSSWCGKLSLKGVPGKEFLNALLKLQDLYVGDKIVTTFCQNGLAPPIDSWKAKQSLMGSIVATQVGGGGDGGLLFQALAEARPMRTVGSDAPAEKRFDAALVAYWAGHAAIETHLKLLEQLRDPQSGEAIEGVEQHSVHDLTSGLMATAAARCSAFVAAFKAQATGLTLGFLHPRNAKSSNDHSKNVTAIVAIGPWSKDKLAQLRGRIGRPCTLEPGDLVPEAFMLVHMSSEWVDSLLASASRRTALNTLAQPEWLAAKLADAKAAHPASAKRITEKTAQLLGMDQAGLLGEDTTMAKTYLTALVDEATRDEAQAKYQAARSDVSFDLYDDRASDDGED